MTTPITADQLARDGVKAIEAYFTARGADAVTEGDGRFTIFIPGGESTETLQLALASTPASRGILARVKTRRTVAQADWPKALLLLNRWNRSSPLPHAVLAARGDNDNAIGHLLVEGLLPASPGVDDDTVARFVDTVVAGARQFWSSVAIRTITTPLPAPAAAAVKD
ncbi:MAG TPA: YbjN domain-containing protein [Acidimicrobiales bacterium]|nr:YbjN domain-containing protein [Acidimicrobiales bacterium]